MKRNRVLLYAPHFVATAGRAEKAYRAIAPLSHLALAGPLQQAGYEVRIIDAKWDTDWQQEVRENADRLACVGVTARKLMDGLLSWSSPTRCELPSG